jgi:hypothetical protein
MVNTSAIVSEEEYMTTRQLEDAMNRTNYSNHKYVADPVESKNTSKKRSSG